MFSQAEAATRLLRLSEKPVPVVTSCNTCKLSFESIEEVKLHYRDELHVLNSKRRAQNLPPVSMEDFRRLPKKPQPNKRLGSSANTVVSQKPKKGSRPSDKSDDVSITSKSTVHSKQAIDATKDEHVRSLIAKLGISEERADSIINKALVDVEDEHSDLSEDEEPEPPLPCAPNISIFDGKEFKSTEDCVKYMYLKYGFFIPDQEYLMDINGLLNYLSEKVKLGGICLYCQKQFPPGRPCMNHMISKSHCKVRYEDGIDLDEYEDFYDYSACYEDVSDSEDEEEVLQINAAGDLILPNGCIAGHRKRRIYYKQYLKPEDRRPAILAQRREELLRFQSLLGKSWRDSDIVSRMSDAQVMEVLHQQQRQVRKLKLYEERAQRRQDFRILKTKEYKSTQDKLRSSATTTAKIRDYHSILV